MEKLTRERAHDLCVEMWNEIAENRHIFKESSCLYEETPSGCFACDFYVYSKPQNYYCKSSNGCPLNIGSAFGCELNESNPYFLWKLDKKREHAIAIADLFIE